MNIENLTYCASLLVSLCKNIWFKITLSSGVIAYSYFFDPTHTQLLLSLFILIILDFITGIAAAVKEKRPIKSHKVLRTAIKIGVYYLIITSTHLAEGSVPIPLLDETAIGFLTATELVSILENVARSGYAVPKSLLVKLKDILGQKTK